MLRPPPFPISIEQLTPEVLSAGLGVEVSSFSSQRIGEDRGMLGSIHLLQLTYASGSTGPAQIVAKFAAQREGSLQAGLRGRANERELRFFDELRALTPINAPESFGTWYDPETAEFLLLQTAIDADESVDQTIGIAVTEAELVIAESARLHARWWGDRLPLDRTWLPRVDGDVRLANLTTLVRNGWQPLCDLLGDELSPDEQALGRELPERLEARLRYVATLPSTVVHSDLRPDNLLFAPDRSSVTLVDWQGCGLGPPAFDLAYLIVQSLTVADRRSHESELLELYRTEAAEAGLELSPDEVRAGYPESLIYGLAIASALPVIGDATLPRVRELTAAVARRTLDAMRDHDQLWETS